MRSLTARISLILGGALVLMLLVAAGVFRAQRQADAHSSARMALPDQTAAIAELIEATAPAELPRVLRALNSPSLRVAVEAQAPPGGARDVALPAVSSVLQSYLGALGGRSVQATLSEDLGRAAPALRLAATSPRLLRLVIRLRDGRYVIVEPRGILWSYVLGLRLAALALLGMLLIAALSLWLLRRQLRPLEQVARAVERFGDDFGEAAIDVGGAREIHRLVDAFERMRSRIRSLVESRTRMLAAISHDLGTYLTRLRLRIELIDDAQQRARAARDIDDMHALMRDSLTLAHIDRHRGVTTQIDLLELTQACVAHFAADGAAVQIIAGEAVTVPGHRGSLSRALDNLIGNALKHAGSAELSVLRSADGRAEIRVEDRGPGIPISERVLEPFQRLDPARNLDLAGSSLGLAIVADVVRRHHGQLQLEHRPGGGLRVCVYLPLAAAA